MHRYGEVTFSESYEPPHDEDIGDYQGLDAYGGDAPRDPMIGLPSPAVQGAPIVSPPQAAPQAGGLSDLISEVFPPKSWLGAAVGLLGGRLLTGSWGWGVVGGVVGGYVGPKNPQFING